MEDIYFNILLQSDINTLYNLCNINKFEKICRSDYFWKIKFSKDNLIYIPNLDKFKQMFNIVDKKLNMIKSYQIIILINNIINDLNQNDVDIKVESNKLLFNFIYILKLFGIKHENIFFYETLKIKNINISKNEFNNYDIIFNKTILNTNTLNLNQLLNFLFYIYYFNYV